MRLLLIGMYNDHVLLTWATHEPSNLRPEMLFEYLCIPSSSFHEITILRDPLTCSEKILIFLWYFELHCIECSKFCCIYCIFSPGIAITSHFQRLLQIKECLLDHERRGMMIMIIIFFGNVATCLFNSCYVELKEHRVTWSNIIWLENEKFLEREIMKLIF